MSNAITQSPATPTLRDFLARADIQQRIADVAAASVKPATITRFALRAVQKVPKLAQCSQNSLLLALMDAAACGLEPDGRKGHLVPFKQDVVFVPGYQGLIDRMREGGAIRDVWTEVVYEGDTFEFERGDAPRLKHIPNTESDSYGDMRSARGVYCCVRLHDGTVHTEYMPRKQVLAIKDGVLKRSGGRPSPWSMPENEGEMWRKTAVRRASKYIPYTPDLAELLMHVDESERAGEARRIEVEVSRPAPSIGERIMGLPAPALMPAAIPRAEEPEYAPSVEEDRAEEAPAPAAATTAPAAAKPSREELTAKHTLPAAATKAEPAKPAAATPAPAAPATGLDADSRTGIKTHKGDAQEILKLLDGGFPLEVFDELVAANGGELLAEVPAAGRAVVLREMRAYLAQRQPGAPATNGHPATA